MRESLEFTEKGLIEYSSPSLNGLGARCPPNGVQL